MSSLPNRKNYLALWLLAAAALVAHLASTVPAVAGMTDVEFQKLRAAKKAAAIDYVKHEGVAYNLAVKEIERLTYDYAWSAENAQWSHRLIADLGLNVYPYAQVINRSNDKCKTHMDDANEIFKFKELDAELILGYFDVKDVSELTDGFMDEAKKRLNAAFNPDEVYPALSFIKAMQVEGRRDGKFTLCFAPASLLEGKPAKYDAPSSVLYITPEATAKDVWNTYSEVVAPETPQAAPRGGWGVVFKLKR
jgi:hypothetical protein